MWVIETNQLSPIQGGRGFSCTVFLFQGCERDGGGGGGGGEGGILLQEQEQFSGTQGRQVRVDFQIGYGS